ncbi:hypothetical protein M140OLGA_1595 [Staphylococcus aureus subsp. aureus 112808A]|nr:hypothetical protein M140OLGA_1595 [Staphylococcus aureus subsp. aureus 112808A]
MATANLGFEEKLWKMAWSWKKTPSTMP